tara:strand:- start:447 stop:599 length:153 start_codon:yes stop_codon:yes gene_type:complete
MIKYLKKMWKKWFGKKEVEVVKPTPEPKPLHCNTHNRFKKSCPVCQEIIK